MRTELAKRVGIRERFTATLQKESQRTAPGGAIIATLCFENVRDSLGVQVAEHVWMDYHEAFWALNLKPGETVSFEARVVAYRKGYRGWKKHQSRSYAVDYQLVNPTRARREKGDSRA